VEPKIQLTDIKKSVLNKTMSNFQSPAILQTDFREIPNIIREHAVAQLVEALRYKPEGRGLDSQWCHWNFSLT
jgi:hypothetical protein